MEEEKYSYVHVTEWVSGTQDVTYKFKRDLSGLSEDEILDLINDGLYQDSEVIYFEVDRIQSIDINEVDNCQFEEE